MILAVPLAHLWIVQRTVELKGNVDEFVHCVVGKAVAIHSNVLVRPSDLEGSFVSRPVDGPLARHAIRKCR